MEVELGGEGTELTQLSEGLTEIGGDGAGVSVSVGVSVVES